MSDRTEDLQQILDRLVQGDPKAKEELIGRAQERLRRLARKMLRGDRVASLEQTDDLLQLALMRLCKALEEVRPESVKGFIGLAAKHIRLELIDLGRHHFGAHGDGRHRARLAPGQESEEPLLEEAAPIEGSSMLDWQNFHENIKELPAEEMEIFDYLYYQELSQDDTARLLGLTERTVQRRWQTAKLNLARLLRGEPPQT